MPLDLDALLSAPLDLGVMPSELDAGVAWRAAIGLVVLATDQTMEHEFRALLRLPGVAVFESRVFNDNDIRPETLRAIGPRIAPSVALILPGVGLDVVAFGCTSATMTLGEDAVFAEIRKARPDVACTTPVTAALAAFRALGAKSIGLLTPYAPEINASLVAYFRGRGVGVAAVATFDRRDDRDAARVSADSIEQATLRLASAPGVEAVFVSCTSLRVAEAAARLEGLASAPVTSSNHAMAWHCLRLAGVGDTLPDAGSAFKPAASATGGRRALRLGWISPSRAWPSVTASNAPATSSCCSFRAICYRQSSLTGKSRSSARGRDFCALASDEFLGDAIGECRRPRTRIRKSRRRPSRAKFAATG